MNVFLTQRFVKWAAGIFIIALISLPVVKLATAMRPEITTTLPKPTRTKIPEHLLQIGGARALATEIAKYEEILAREDLSPDSRRIYQENLEAAQRELDRMMRPTPNVRKTYGPPPTSTPAPQPTSPLRGIVNDPFPGYFPRDLKIQNFWIGQGARGEHISVAAGALAENPQQGILLVERETSQSVQRLRYLTPVEAGTIRIVGVRGLKLILETENGEIFYFDVQGQQFVSSLAEIVPTVTPYPTPEPTQRTEPTPMSTIPSYPYP